MDLDKITEVITEEVRRYLSQPVEGTGTEPACDCPLPAVSGSSVQDGVNAESGSVSITPSQSPGNAARSSGQKVLCLIHGEIEQRLAFDAALGNWPSDGVAVEAMVGDDVSRAEFERRGVRLLSSASELGTRNENLKSYRAILLPSLDRTFAAKISLGISDEGLTQVVFSALAYRVPVLAAHERLLPNSQTAHGNNLPGMADKIAQYRGDLERMGIRVLAMKEMLSQVLHSARVATPDSGEVITHIITREDAGKLPGPVIRVARGGLVTAMARELLTQRGIQIEIVDSSRT
ncbi:MAG: hypothetical protein ABIH23_28440 [bacterium]